MTRVTENTSSAALRYTLNKTKGKLEKLQMQGSNLKRMNKPSDDPVGNIDLMKFRSAEYDSVQYRRNANFAGTLLSYTETALEDLTNIMVRAKELAIAQASDFYNAEARKNVSNEIIQLKKQTLAIANKRFGNRYMFAGYTTLQPPFTESGKYSGDEGHIYLEVAKDFFVPTNLNGFEVFFSDKVSKIPVQDPFAEFPEGLRPKEIRNEKIPENTLGPQDNIEPPKETNFRGLASVKDDPNLRENNPAAYFANKQTLFEQLQLFIDGLATNNSTIVQDLLPTYDESINRLINLRTRIGALTNALDNSEVNLQEEEIVHAAHKSKIEDADVAEVFSDLAKFQNILKTSYKAGSALINHSLLDFLR